MKKTLITLLFCYFLFFLNAQSWENPFNDVYQLDSLNIWIVGDNGTIINTKDGGNSWSDFSIDTSISLRCVCFNTIESGYIRKTIDGGETYGSMELDSTQSNYSVFFLDESHGWICAGYGGLYKTIDGGNTWSHIEDSIKKVIFFDSLNGWGEKSHYKLVRTNDGGNTWVYITTFGWEGAGGGSFYFMSTSAGFISKVIGANIYNFKTIDAGQTWTEVYRPYCFHGIDFDGNLNGWDAAENGIYFSNDLFETYEYFQLPNDSYLYDISVWGISNGWAVGSKDGWDNGCIWKLVGINEWVEILPAGINENSPNLIQLNAFPNPSTKTLKIEFELKNACEVIISIHNNIGQEIQTIFTGRKTKGKSSRLPRQ